MRIKSFKTKLICNVEGEEEYDGDMLDHADCFTRTVVLLQTHQGNSFICWLGCLVTKSLKKCWIFDHVGNYVEKINILFFPLNTYIYSLNLPKPGSALAQKLHKVLPNEVMFWLPIIHPAR